VRAELLQLAAELTRREEPFALALVARRAAPSSAQLGDAALVTAAGAFHGWLGGSCTHSVVVREARAALADGRPRRFVLAPEPEAERRPGVDAFPMTCHSGGTVEIHLEPVLPAPRLVVYGDSPAARALAALGKDLGYAIVDGSGAAPAEPAAPGTRAPRFAVVATLGEDDEAAIREALALAPDYLGVVASARRFAEMRRTLLAQGVAAAALDAIRCPAGLDIGARTPEEIALSVLAEIVQRRRAAAPREAPVAAPAQAVDPICGMTVEIAGARHTAEHAGRTFYFCCGGCRGKFLAEPERYAAAAGGVA
jgi:xanthine dehydrogenase accessory factor